MTDLDTLVRIAVELVVRVRDEPPDTNAAWLTEALPDPGDWFRLAFTLACAVPDNRPWNQLTAWTRTGRLCGLTPSGHRWRGEVPCDDCLRHDRERKRAERSAA